MTRAALPGNPKLEGRADAPTVLRMREANEGLVLATLHAQTMAAASEQAAIRLREANEHLVLATVHAQMLAELAEQAAEQVAYRSKVEAKLMEAQKLETLGVLAAGVAHDFNNLLTAIIGYTDLGRLAAEPGSDLARYFAGIDHASSRAGELTRQLMTYTGKGSRQMEEVDLTLVIREIAHLYGVSLPGQVSLRWDLADRIPFIKGDPTQIFQIAMNLLSNAAEACPAGTPGRITLTTCALQIDAAGGDAAAWVLPPAPGRYASLEVTDNGVGMTPEILARVFEPFFTTKPAGHGLGLAAVTGIVRSHGGGIWAASEPGRGSSFRIVLPALAGARSLPILESRPAWRGEGSLLIVEPEPEASGQARHLAEHLGFTVLDAADGPEAKALFRSRHGGIALVVMALDLPHQGGVAAFRAMQAIDSDVPVVLTCGFREPEAGLATEGLAGGLRTPFRAAEFQGLLQRILDPEGTGAPGPA